VRTERNMSLDLASRIASATVAACSAGGYNVTAAVVDRAGQLRALYSVPTTPARTHWLPAQAKAFTSASARNTHPGHDGKARRRTRLPPTWP
jgi:uncharacterized protein GlcG (DUF336 family)